MTHHRRTRVAGLLAAGALAVSLAACGAEETPGDAVASEDGAAASEDTAAAPAAEVAEIIEVSSAPLAEEVPTESSAIATDKLVVVIPCTYASEACARGADAAIEAATHLGWETRMIDPAGDPEQSRQAIDQAINLGADGIIFTAAVGDLLREKLDEAREAGIFLVNSMSPGDERFDIDIEPDEDASGQMMAALIAQDSGGDGKVLVTTDPAFPSVAARTEAFERWLPELCPGCEIVETLETQMSQLQSGLPQQVQATLTAKPEIEYIWTHTGAAVVGSQPSVERSANGESVKMVSYDGNAANLDLISAGKNQFADVIKPMEWAGYRMVHELNRLFAGDLTEYELIDMPKRLVTEQTMPDLPWTGDSDWQRGFEDLWADAS